MEVILKGDGEAQITVVGAVHGDEPAGKNAIENFLDQDFEFKQPVKFIIANEEALAENTRFLDADLNRSFPGNSESENHEERLASKLMDEIRDTYVLDLHTTRSFPEPFATFTHLNDEVVSLMKDAGVKYAAHFPEEAGTLHEQTTGIVVETGHQGTKKARENAVKVIKKFLSSRNVIDTDEEDLESRDGEASLEIFQNFETVEGDWKFKARNFEKVEKGEVYAEKDEEKLRASESFYPVLMSTKGYDGMLGYKARKEKEFKN